MEDQETTSDWSQLSPEIADVETDNSSPDVETRHGSRRDRRHHIKCMRKRKAIHASLLREMGRPVIVSHPTRVLCLLNAASGGIACVTREELEATLAPFKGFVAVHLTIGKVSKLCRDAQPNRPGKSCSSAALVVFLCGV
jgi:hypothetical protein